MEDETDRLINDAEAGESPSKDKPSRCSPIKIATIVGSVICLGLLATLIALLVTGYVGSKDGTRHYAELNGHCDHVPRIQPEEFLERQQRMTSALDEVGYLALVMEPGATMLYFTDVSWKQSERPFLFVIRGNGETFWVCPAFEEGKAREYVGEDATLVLWNEDENPYDKLAAYLGAPFTGETVAVDSEARLFIFDGIAQSLGDANAVINGFDIVRDLRVVKSENEIALLRCANEVTKTAIRMVAERLRGGMTEDDIAAEITYALTAAGLSDTWNIVLFGPNAAYPHGTDKRVPLHDGDLILLDAGGSLGGYQSDITRTFNFPLGQFNEEQQKMWNTVRDAQQAALNAIQLGAPCSALDDAARAVVEAAGYGGNYTSFTHRLGHGIGLQGHEEAYMVRGNDYPLRAGMCFSVEPGIYIIGTGGVRIEDIVCTTETEPYYEVFGPTTDTLTDPFAQH